MKTHKWKDLMAKMPPERVARAERKAELMLAAMDLQDLLCDRGITQEELAQQMEIGQGNVSRMLRRTNMNVNTLQDAIEAMGGKLEIIAHFPDKDYRIDQFAPG
jgi:DNA-binding Xre family transcriptional regulator